MMPYVTITIQMLDEKVDKMNPMQARRDPPMVTARHPYLLERTLARGPKLTKISDPEALEVILYNYSVCIRAKSLQ